MKNIKRVIAFALLLVFTMLTFTGCNGCASNDVPEIEEESTEEEVVYRIMPPQAFFSSISRKIEDIRWSDFLNTNAMKMNQDYVGYQLGSVFVNWSIAAILKDEKKAHVLATNWMELTSDIDIDDDAITLKMKDAVDALEKFFTNRTEENHEVMNEQISEVINDLEEYYQKVENETMVRQIGFGIWFEFLHLGVEGILANYDQAKTTIFNREGDLNYFIQEFGKDPALAEMVTFLQKIKPRLTLEEGETISKEQLISLRNELEDFRLKYVAN